MKPDPFKALSEASNGGGNGAPLTPPQGVLICPAPINALPAMSKHKTHGIASQVWTYKGPKGEVLGHVARFDKPDGTKAIMPQTYWRDDRGEGWRWKGWPEQRPLYGLDSLAAKPEAPVLIVEGEKTADAAAGLFPDLVTVCWQGGANATAKADFGPLQGRRCVILPDADDAGLKAARSVRGQLQKIGVRLALIIALPEALPKGWDCADEFTTGFSLDDLKKLIVAALNETETATTVINAQSDGWPSGFVMSESGLWVEPKDTEKKPSWVCSPFEVLGEARDGDGLGWSVVIKFKDRDGAEKLAILQNSKLTTASTEIRATLADQGLGLPRKSPQAADHLADFLLKIKPPERIKLCHATGWSGDVFVLPSEVISKDGAERALFTGEAKALHFGRKGSEDTWIERVAKPVAGNTRGVFAIALALAGPLLKPLGQESGGFHFRGSSSCGKSTLAMVCGSVWGGGGPLGLGQSWRATANALENMATGHSDSCLILDELAQVSPDEAGGAAYMLSNGQAKARLKSDSSLRSRSQWRTVFLSTGEVSLGDHIKAAKSGGDIMAGQELRVIDLAAAVCRETGVWDFVPSNTTASAFSDSLKGVCKAHYGHIGPKFVKAMIEGGDEFITRTKAFYGAFIGQAVKPTDTGQVSRVAHRFALVAAAGEMAIASNILPWREGEAITAALELFEGWAKAFGRSALKEDTTVLRRIVDVIQRDGSQFAHTSLIEDDENAGPRSGEARSLKILGYHADGFYFFTSTGWEETFKGLDKGRAAKVLYEAGYLIKSEEGRHMKKKKIKGKSMWLYWVKDTILEHDFEA